MSLDENDLIGCLFENDHGQPDVFMQKKYDDIYDENQLKQNNNYTLYKMDRRCVFNYPPPPPPPHIREHGFAHT